MINYSWIVKRDRIEVITSNNVKSNNEILTRQIYFDDSVARAKKVAFVFSSKKDYPGQRG